MRQFLKFIVATMVGLFLFNILILFFVMGIGAAFSGSDTTKIEPNSVLKMSLSQSIPEKGNDNPFADVSPFNFEPSITIGLKTILENIKKAKEDDNIKGIYLEMSGFPSGLATAEEIRNALLDFKESGKFIVAYGEGITQKAYYLASIADEIYLNPEGMVELKGFGAELTFVKNTLEKLDIEPVIFYAGDFKSATEPLRYEKMSEPNRLQYTELLNGFQDIYLERVAKARNMPKTQLFQIMDQLKVRNASDAAENKVVDGLYYVDQVYDNIREKLGIEEDDKIKFVSNGKYKKAPKKKGKLAKEKIAVVYAQGGIAGGKGQDGSTIGSDSYVKILQKIRRDDKVKAVVLRINSGGGSALASEIIWRELKLFKDKGIPVVASMGDVAASGGYYIPVIADTILAQENTITGSIGVFAALMNGGDFYNEHLGMTFDTVKTTRFADFPTSALLTRDMNAEERSIFQKSVDDIYEKFLKRVAEGRGMTRDQVHAIAQGRVWTGRDAKEKGLVDVIGGIDDAIAIAAKMADLEEYRLSTYPRDEDPFQKILKEFNMARVQEHLLKEELGPLYKQFKTVKNILEYDGVQARMPFEIEVH